MTPEPGAEKAATAAGRGHLRASQADREHVIGSLKAAFVQGRLTKDELDLRAGQTFAARTYWELAAVTADLPAGLTTASPPGQPSRTPMNTAAKASICAGIMLATLVLLTAVFGPLGFVTAVVFYFLFSLAAAPRRSTHGSRGAEPTGPAGRRAGRDRGAPLSGPACSGAPPARRWRVTPRRRQAR